MILPFSDSIMTTVSSESGSATPTDLEPASPEVKRYQKLKHLITLTSVILMFLFLCIMAFVAGPALDPLVRSWVGDNPWLRLVAIGFLYAAAMELLSLPFDFWSGYVLEHQYGLSNQTFLAWLWQKIKGYLIGGPLGLVVLLGLYALIWNAGDWWWLAATAGWLVLTLVLGRLVPVLILPLFYKVTRLDDPALQERLETLARGTGLSIEGVYRLHLSAETRKANA